MTETYKAIEVTKPGVFSEVRRSLLVPGHEAVGRQGAIDRFTGELSFGGGAVNQVNIHLFIESMPFGGVFPPYSNEKNASLKLWFEY
jgi:hypothetical protein